MPALKKEMKYTIEDIYILPDGQRAELIDGVMYDMAPPNTEHQRIVHFLDRTLGNAIEGKGGSCEVFPAPFGVQLKKDDKTYVEPDLSVICDTDKIDKQGCHGAPDLVIEIVSKSSRSMDYLHKLVLYQAEGVREYWIVDPEKERIVVYLFEQGVLREYGVKDKVPVTIFEDVCIDFSQSPLVMGGSAHE